MSSGNIWIERGLDGRPYFVRKKSRLPSTRQLLINAIAPLRERSLLLSKAFRRDPYIAPVAASHPLYLPEPPYLPSSFNPTSAQPQNNHARASFQPAIMYRFPPQSTSQPNTNTSNATTTGSNSQRGAVIPQPQSYPAPHPDMHPIPPTYSSTPLNARYPPQTSRPLTRPPPPFPMYHEEVFPPAVAPFSNLPPGAISAQPPGVHMAQPLHHGARVISPPRRPTAEDLRYKCGVCGRFRSTRYHYQHPIPSGQLPEKTVCRKCREEATDSEDKSSDSYKERKYSRRQSRSRSRAGPVRGRYDGATGGRGRSQKRIEYFEDEDEKYDDRYAVRPDSRSSSMEVRPVQVVIRRDRPRRPRSPSAEVVRYVERPKHPPLARRVTYVENQQTRGPRDYDWHHEEPEYHHEYPRRTRRHSRAPTPAPRVIHRQYSDPLIYNPQAVERGGYFDGPPWTRHEQGPIFRPGRRSSRPSSSHGRVVSMPEHTLALERCNSDSDTGEHGASENQLYARNRSARGRARTRSGSRSGNRSRDGRKQDLDRRVVAPRVTQPPRLSTSSSLAYMEPSEQEIARSRSGRESGFAPVLRSRRRGPRGQERSGSAGSCHSAGGASVLSSGEGGMGGQGSGGGEDYDWYDQNGMRVRVREI